MNALHDEHKCRHENHAESTHDKRSRSTADQAATSWLTLPTFCLPRFASHLLTCHEQEHQLLAENVHDLLGQNLLALRIDVSMLHARTLGTHPRLNRKAATMLKHIDVALANVREIINSLHPPVLALGLLAAIEWKIYEFEKCRQIPCTLHIGGLDSAYMPYDNRAPPIVRILHEALSNVACHAAASHIDVVLATTRQELILTVSDDGIGIRQEQLSKDGAHGLLWIRARVAALDGEFAIGTRQLQKGTVLTISIPQ